MFENVFKKHLKTSVYSISIKTLFGERLTKKIDYQPYYQRNYVWDATKASFFIESILLGTDIPPLIFFNTGKKIEVIDGRQRYETIKRFRNGNLKLNLNGLDKLTQLQKATFSTLDDDVKELFEDAKIRVFEFEVINEPKLDSSLEDRIKKEIFRRYNSGITPLNSAEIDNALYTDDQITNYLKQELESQNSLKQIIQKYFIRRDIKDEKSVDAEILQFLRKYLVFTSFPIKSYARGASRSVIFELLYTVKANNTEADCVADICSDLISNLYITTELIEKISSKDQDNDRYLNECLLWAISVLNEEEFSVRDILKIEKIESIKEFLAKNLKQFRSENSHHYSSIISRFSATANLFNQITQVDLSPYIQTENFSEKVKEMRQTEKEAKLKLEELSSLRVQKPEPSLIPVEQMVEELNSNRYLIRPSYQRQEKINDTKAAAIIESILLGINLPPIFLFKNKHGVREVIDGQQRLLSIVGFLGKKYTDNHGKQIFPKNINYKLKRLRILKELNGRSYDELDFTDQEKILDFRLSIIEIDYALNMNFEPVDLFIRLNNKPYPIKENSFEMWNSFMDREIIQKIKEITNKNIQWFFIYQRTDDYSSTDRMLNEELVTLLAYIHHMSSSGGTNGLGYYLKDSRINCRIREKKSVSILLEKISKELLLKKKFLESISFVEKNITLIEGKLLPDDKKGSFTTLLRSDVQKRYLVDFYMLFQILSFVDVFQKEQISYDQLKSMMSEIQLKLDSPNELSHADDIESRFNEFIKGLVQNVGGSG